MGESLDSKLIEWYRGIRAHLITTFFPRKVAIKDPVVHLDRGHLKSMRGSMGVSMVGDFPSFTVTAQAQTLTSLAKCLPKNRFILSSMSI